MYENYQKQNKKRWKVSIIITLIGLLIAALLVIFSFFEMRKNLRTISFLDALSDCADNYEEIFLADAESFSDDEKLIFYGDLTQETTELQQKAIHDKFPENKVYLANYITNIPMRDILDSTEYNELTEYDRAEAIMENQRVIKILNYAQAIDPENALYNYYKCYIYLTEAVIDNPDYVSSNKKREVIRKERREGVCQPFAQKNKLLYNVIDEKKFALAMTEYEKGLVKPYLKTYAMDLAKERVGFKFKKITNIHQIIEKMTLELGVLLPELGRLRTIARAVTFKAQTAYINNDIAETKRLLNTWQPFLKQTNDSSSTLIAVLVDIAVGKIFVVDSCDFYNQIKDKEQLAYYTKKYQEIDNVLDQVRDTENITKKARGHIALLSGLLLPAMRIDYSLEEFIEKLRPERMVWYKILEKFTIVILSSYLFIAILIILGFSVAVKNKLYLEFPGLVAKKSVIISPKFKDYLTIIGVGMILPIAIYLAVTNIDAFSGRDFFLVNNISLLVQIGMQMLLLIFTITVPIFYAVSLIVRRHCKNNNITIGNLLNVFAIGYIICYLGLILLSTPLIQLIVAKDTSHSELLNISIIVISLGLLLLWAIGLGYIIVAMLKNDVAKRLVLINIMPYFAISSSVVAIIMFTTFNFQENYYFMKDELIFTKNFEQSFTVAEYNLTLKLKKLFAENVVKDSNPKDEN